MTGPQKRLVSVALVCALIGGCTTSPPPSAPSVLSGDPGFPLPLQDPTRKELVAKGLPLMPAARKLACRQTARQDMPEVVEDLGNLLVSDLCAVCVKAWGSPSELKRYYRQTFNIKVLRLIEEGREDPRTVSGLLYAAIENGLAEFERASKACSQAREQGMLPSGIKWDDPYYQEHRRYEHPITEFERLQDVNYMAFYILANIGRLEEPRLLADWIEKQQQIPHCMDMDVWLVDCHFSQNDQETEAAHRHGVMTNWATISRRRVRQSRWNAAWDIHDPLLTSNKVDTRGIKTIEVLEIPPKLPDALDEETKARVIRNFLDYAKLSGQKAEN
jgi:hypothetical protein